MAVKSNLLNMALCLTAVCLVCAAILGYIYTITFEPIREASAKALRESVGRVLPEGGSLSGEMEGNLADTRYVYYTSTFADGEVCAYAVKSTVTGFGGPLTVMVGVLPDGTVWNTSVLDCNETPGLGAKCATDNAFLSQWKGFTGNIRLKKDGGDVDAITASTITSRAYTLAVANAVALVMSFEKEEQENE